MADFITVPVDHDPFKDPAPAAEGGYSLMPVDFDPFAGSQPQPKGTALTRGFVSGVAQQMPENVADALEGASLLVGAPQFGEWGEKIRSIAHTPDGYQTQTRGLADIKGVSSGLTYAGERLGEGLASTLPSLAGSVAGGLGGASIAGPAGGAIGSVAGAFAPSMAQSYGELYRALKDEGVSPEDSARVAALGALPIAGLDVVPVARWTSRLTGTARQEAVRGMAKRVAQELAKGAATEGATEAAQQAIQEGIVATAADKPALTWDRAQQVLEAAIAGGLTGGAIGGVTGIAPDRPAPQPSADTKQDAPPAAPPPLLALPSPAIPMPDQSGEKPPLQVQPLPLPGFGERLALPPASTTYGDGFTARDPRPGEGYNPPPIGITGPAAPKLIEGKGTPLLPGPDGTYGEGFFTKPVKGDPFAAPAPDGVAAMINAAAAKAGIDPALFTRQIAAESAFKPGAVSPKGAQGLAQLMPPTAAYLARKHGIDPTTPQGNLEGGALYFAEQMKRFGGDVRLALAAYNAGPGRVTKMLKAGKDFSTLPRETQEYVAKIMAGADVAVPGGGQQFRTNVSWMPPGEPMPPPPPASLPPPPPPAPLPVPFPDSPGQFPPASGPTDPLSILKALQPAPAPAREPVQPPAPTAAPEPPRAQAPGAPPPAAPSPTIFTPSEAEDRPLIPPSTPAPPIAGAPKPNAAAVRPDGAVSSPPAPSPAPAAAAAREGEPVDFGRFKEQEAAAIVAGGRERGEPVLDIRRRPTGWVRVRPTGIQGAETGDVVLVHPTKLEARRFSGPRASIHSAVYAIDNPVEPEATEPAELVVKPLFDKPAAAEAQPAAPAAPAPQPPASEPAPAARSEPAEEKAAQEPAEAPYTLAEHGQIAKRIAAGDITAEELKANFARLQVARPSITAELSKRTLKDLAPNGTNGLTKPKVIDAIIDRMMMRYVVGDGFSWSPMSETQEAAYQRVVGATTDEQIKAAAEKRTAAIEGRRKALSNPETLSEFRSFIDAKGAAALTPEQRAQYDELLAEQDRAVRDREKARAAVVNPADIGDAEMEIVETTHTKKGTPLFVVTLSQRVGSDAYKDLLAKAKRIGGYYSAFRGPGAVPGFQFPTRDAAEKFASLKEGPVSVIDEAMAREAAIKDGAAKRLRAMAERLDAVADESLSRDRKDNTDRRARMAASAEEEARRQKATAATMRNLADAIASGKAKHLNGIRHATDIETLDSILRQAHYQRARVLDKRGEGKFTSLSEAPITADAVEHTVYPYPRTHVDNARRLAEAGENLPGAKRAAAKLGKLAQAADRAGMHLVELTAPDEIDAGRVIAAEGKAADSTAATMLGDEIKGYDRMQRMGLRDLPTLRAALREYLEYRGVKAKEDPIKMRERELLLRQGENWFATPVALAERMVEEAGIKKGDRVLEPSAGTGRIADAAADVVGKDAIEAFETSTTAAALLVDKGYATQNADFLGVDPKPEYDAVLMNPPFGSGADIEHVRHAWGFVKPGGKLVAIMSEGPFFREDRKAREFRDWLESVDGTSEKLPDGTFKESGTGVATRLVTVKKRGAGVDVGKPGAIDGYSDEHPQWARDHEPDIGGKVVWSSGDIALVEGFSALTGAPVYVAANGPNRTRVDIESYAGDAFTADEKARLIAGKKAFIAEQEKKHAARPDGPFADSKRFVATPGVPEGVAGVAEQWLGLLGINARVFLTTSEDVEGIKAAERYGLYGPFAAVRSAKVATQNDRGGKRRLANGDYHVIIKPSSRASATLETVAHEFGHILQSEAWGTAPADTKRAIEADFAAWLKTAGETNVADWVRQLRAHTMGKTTNTPTPILAADKAPPYWRSFNEWFADQVSRWANTEDRPVSVVERFFARIGAALKRLYRSLAAKEQYGPTKTMREYLNARMPVDVLQAASPQPAKGPAPAAEIDSDVARRKREYLPDFIRETEISITKNREEIERYRTRLKGLDQKRAGAKNLRGAITGLENEIRKLQRDAAYARDELAAVAPKSSVIERFEIEAPKEGPVPKARAEAQRQFVESLAKARAYLSTPEWEAKKQEVYAAAEATGDKDAEREWFKEAFLSGWLGEDKPHESTTKLPRHKRMRALDENTAWKLGIEHGKVNKHPVFRLVLNGTDRRLGRPGFGITTYDVKPSEKAIDDLTKRFGSAPYKRLFSLFGRTTAPSANEQRVAERIIEIVKQIAPAADVRVVRELLLDVGAGEQQAGGAYEPLKRLVTVALNFGDPEQTAGHEAIHALRDMGVFTAEEDALLVKTAREKWIDQHKVRDFYPGASEEMLIEEAIAEAFAEWRMKPTAPQFTPAHRRLFSRMRTFFQRLANALRGMGFRTADDVFGAAASGEIGARSRQPSMGGPVMAAAFKEPAAPVSVGANLQRGRAAMDRVMSEHSDQRYAVHRPDVGWVSFVWGKEGDAQKNYSDGNGVAHIIARRNLSGRNGEAIARSMVETIVRGDLSQEHTRGKNVRRRVTLGRYVAVLDMRHDATGDVWLLTGFEERKGERGSDVDHQPIATDDDYTNQTSRSSSDRGAEPPENIAEDERGPKASFFTHLRAAAPAMAQPAQQHGTAEQRAAVEAIIGKRDAKPWLQRAREAIREYTDRGALELKQGFLDQFAAIEALEKGQGGGKLKDATESAYKATRMTRNLQSVMAHILRHGPIDVHDDPKTGGRWFRPRQNWKGGGFADIFKPLAEKGLLDLWRGWAAAVRANRLMREGRERLMTQDQIDALLPLGDQYPEFREAHRKWRQFNKAALDMAEGAGIINADQRESWENDDYVPFYRILDEQDKGTFGRGKEGISGQRSGIVRLEGGTEQLADPIENMVRNLTGLIDRSYKNLAMQKVTALAVDAGAMEKKTAATARQYGDDVPAVSVMIDGKPVYYHVHDPLLLRAITSISPQQLGGVMALFRMAKRVLTESVTLDPAFMVANGIRDTLSAWVTTGQKGFRPGIDSVSGFVKALRSDPSRLAIMAAGAGTGGYYGTAPEDARRFIERHVRRFGKESILDTPRKLWEAWHAIGAASESANRIAIYEAAKKAGATDEEASFQALDLMDFGMRGDFAAMRAIIDMVPFLNARIQGLYRLGRGIAENPKQFLLRGSIITAATLALLAANWDNPEYEALEDWDKDTYWHIWVGGQHLRLPKPFEVGALFATVPERMFRALLGRDSTKASADAALRMVMDTFAFNPTPQLVAPLVEQFANKDMFTGRPIEGVGMERLPPGMRARPDTSEVAQEVGELTGISPLRLQHAVGGYFGTLGLHLLAAADQVAEWAGGYPVEPTLRIDEIPVVQRFMREDPARSTRFVTEFYNMRREAAMAMAGFKELQARGQVDEAREFLADKRDKLAMYKGFEKAADALSQMNKASIMIRRSPDMTADQKRERLDAITRQRNEISKAMVERAAATAKMIQQLSANDAARQNLIEAHGQ